MDHVGIVESGPPNRISQKSIRSLDSDGIVPYQKPDLLGANIIDTKQVATQENYQLPRGSYIYQIHNASSAEAMGLKHSDVILRSHSKMFERISTWCEF